MPKNFDLPERELYNYGGTNPCPPDFDRFWDDGLAELAATPEDAEVEPAAFQAPFARCEHLWFSGTGPARIHAKLVRPLADPPQPAPAVLLFHGYGGQSSEWFQMLPYAARGYTVAALDVRGQGGPSQDVGRTGVGTLSGHLLRGIDDGPEALFFRHVFLDTRRLADIVMARPTVDPDRVGTLGWSQGGGLSLVCAALQPRVKRTAAVYPFLSDYLRAYELGLDEAPYNEIAGWFRSRDPQHQRQDEIFRTLGYIDVQFLAPRIRARVDLTVALEDQICPPSTQFAVYNRLETSRSVRLYPDLGHDDLPGAKDEIFTVLGDL